MTSNTENNSSERQRAPDLVNAEIALKRAARKARENARKTGVPVVIMKDGKIMEEQIGSYANPDH